MNEIKKDSCYMMTVLSNKRANDKASGALTVNGGIGVGNNIYAKGEIYGNELIAINNSRVGKNLYVMGTIESDKMFHINENDILFMKNLVSKGTYDIGTKDTRWANIYSTTLNSVLIDTEKINASDISIGSSMSIGINELNNSSVFVVEDGNIIINGNMTAVDSNMEPYLTLDKDNRTMSLFNLNAKIISTMEQTIILEDEYNMIDILSNVIFIDNRHINGILEIKKNKINGVQNIKMILISNKYKKRVKILFGSDATYLDNIGDSLEYIYTGDKMILLK